MFLGDGDSDTLNPYISWYHYQVSLSRENKLTVLLELVKNKGEKILSDFNSINKLKNKSKIPSEQTRAPHRLECGCSSKSHSIMPAAARMTSDGGLCPQRGGSGEPRRQMPKGAATLISGNCLPDRNEFSALPDSHFCLFSKEVVNQDSYEKFPLLKILANY